MREVDVGGLLGDAHRGVHEADEGGEDQLVARGRELADDAVGIRPLVDALDIGGLHLVAEVILDGAAGDVVAVRPAEVADRADVDVADRSEEHTSELQSLMRISYAVFCLKKKN